MIFSAHHFKKGACVKPTDVATNVYAETWHLSGWGADETIGPRPGTYLYLSNVRSKTDSPPCPTTLLSKKKPITISKVTILLGCCYILERCSWEGCVKVSRTLREMVICHASVTRVTLRVLAGSCEAFWVVGGEPHAPKGPFKMRLSCVIIIHCSQTVCTSAVDWWDWEIAGRDALWVALTWRDLANVISPNLSSQMEGWPICFPKSY